jgi:hypothetical protein
MNKKILIILSISFLLTLVNIGIASISTAEEVVSEKAALGGYETPVVSVHHADANGPYSGNVNEPISFSADGTYVSGTATYEWDFDDDTIGYEKNPIHIYSNPGEYIVTLTVTDSTGEIYKDIAPVFIDKPGDHLIPNGGCHYPAEAYEEIEFNASNSISTGADIVEYFWDFGDGTTAYGETITHSYDTERIYFVTLEITDSNGVKRFDALHADIGMSYSDDHNCYSNIFVDPEVSEFLEYLLDTFDFTTGILCGVFDAQIYTNYNGFEKLTDLQGISPLPVSVDVNGDGDEDIQVEDLDFFKTRKARSLFDSNSKLWYQFETTISNIKTLTSDITPDIDFTVALQLDFGIIASYLELDDTLMRIGYHSAPGETMPSSIEVNHIFRPYLLFRILGWNYWPEYGIEVKEGSAGDFSFLSTILNSAGSSKTTFEMDVDTSGSSLIYRRTKDGGILNHAVILDIPSGPIDFNVTREKYGEITTISSEFIFTGSLTRGFSWKDQEIYIGILGETEVGLYDFYFDNPVCTITLGEISFSSSGSANINFDKPEGKLSIVGVGTGFTLRDLFVNSKNSDFEAEIQGNLDLHLADSVLVALSQSEFIIGFDGEIELSSDCNFRINDETVTVGGHFSLESDGDISFTWAENELDIGLEAGLELEIIDLNFEVGNLLVNASLIEIETSGSFGIEWDTAGSLVTLSGGDGVSSAISDLEVIYDAEPIELVINVYGRLEISAGGWITFGADTFEAGFYGVLDLGTGGAFCEFDINGDNIKVGGSFELSTGGGEIAFIWADNQFSLDVAGNPELSVDDLYFEIGLEGGETIKVTSDNIGVGADCQFGVTWDTAENEVTINAEGGVSLSTTNLEITYGTLLNIKTFGTLEIQGDGWLTFGEDTFKAGLGFEGSLTLLGEEDPFVIFEINGEAIEVGGVFTLIDGGGEISFEWINGEFSLSVSGDPELEIQGLHFKADISGNALLITSQLVNLGAGGDISVLWDTTSSEMTITSDAGLSIGIEDFAFDFDSGGFTVQVMGSLEVQAGGSITLSPGFFEASFTGSLNLGGVGMLDAGEGQGTSNSGGIGFNGDIGGEDFGTGVEFIINGDSLHVGGLFQLEIGDEEGTIGFIWDGNEFTFDVNSDVTMTVEEFYFEVEIEGVDRQTETLKITVDEISVGADGEFNLHWDTGINELEISSGGGVTIQIENVNFTYGTTIDASITGSLEIQADGGVTLTPGSLTASFSGALDFGTSCTFKINEDSLSVGGQFSIDAGNGELIFTWSDINLNLDFSGSSTLTATNFYFEASDLKVTGDQVEINAAGEFDVDLDTANNQVTISSGTSGISLYIENIEIIYDPTLEVEIQGSLEIEANGHLTFGDGVFEAGFSGTLNLGISTQFIINGDGITVGGVFNLIGGDGEISFSWLDEVFSLSVSGGPSLSVDDLYFEADISGETLIINSDLIHIAAYGEINVEWETANEKVTVSAGESGIDVDIDTIYVTYGDSIDVSINGFFRVQAGGSIGVSPGSIELMFSGTLQLEPDLYFDINDNILYFSGDFELSSGEGTVLITWTDDELNCDVYGGFLLTISDMYFELPDKLKIESDDANLAFGTSGGFTIKADKTVEEVEISGDATFSFKNLRLFIYDNNLEFQILYVNNLQLIGGGSAYAKSGSNGKIEVSFDGSLTITNLNLNPPPSWNFNLQIGSASLSGNDVHLKLFKEGDVGKFELNSDASGQITGFDADVTIGSTSLEVDLDNLEIEAAFSVTLDDSFDNIALDGEGTVIVEGFDAVLGSLDISLDVDAIGSGDIDAEWTEDTIDLSFDADFSWLISLSSSIIGDWEATGELLGDVDIYADTSSDTKFVEITVNGPGSFNLLQLTHGDITLDLLDFDLNLLAYPKTITFEWQRNDAQQTGYILIDSELQQSTESAGQLVKITVGSKSISFGWPKIQIGDFKFDWNIPLKTLKINNGISGLGPTVTYGDIGQDLEIEVSALDLVSDYAETINVQWYEDSLGISGIYLDTANTELAQLIEGSVIKNDEGFKLALYGLKCDEFYIKRTLPDPNNPNYEWGGTIQLANHFTFSKYDNGDWEDFDVQWNFQNPQKWIRLEKDYGMSFTLNVLDVYIWGFEIDLDVNLLHLDLEYIDIKWDIGTEGRIDIDTGNEWAVSVDLTIWHQSTQTGLRITQGGFKADAWWIEWDAWPPQEWNIETGGTLDITGIEIEVYNDGEWVQIWPW